MTNNANFNGEQPSGSQHPTPPEWSRMQLEAMRLERSPAGGFRFKMPGPRGWVTEKTLRATWTLFWRSAHKLDRGRTHSAEDLACIADWADRPKGERIAMGRCFKYFALHGVLPITLVNPEAKYNFKYRVNANLEQAPAASY